MEVEEEMKDELTAGVWVLKAEDVVNNGVETVLLMTFVVVVLGLVLEAMEVVVVKVVDPVVGLELAFSVDEEVVAEVDTDVDAAKAEVEADISVELEDRLGSCTVATVLAEELTKLEARKTDEEVVLVDEEMAPELEVERDDAEDTKMLVVVSELVGIGEGGAIVLSGITTEVPLPGTFAVVILLVVERTVVRLLPMPPSETPSEVEEPPLFFVPVELLVFGEVELTG